MAVSATDRAAGLQSGRGAEGAAAASSKANARTEVNLKRLLRRCEERVEADAAGDDWRRDPVFHSYVTLLQDQLAELGADPVDPRETSDVRVQGFQERVKAISDQLERQDLPTYCRVIPSHMLPAVSTVSAAPDRGDDGAAASTAAGMGGVGDAGLRQRPRMAVGGGAAARRAEATGSSQMQRQLEEQRGLQDTITDEMVSLAADIKSNVQLMEASLQKRAQLLESAEDAADRSLSQTKRAGRKAGSLFQQGQSSTWTTLYVLFLTGVIFTFMYMLIRFT